MTELSSPASVSAPAWVQCFFKPSGHTGADISAFSRLGTAQDSEKSVNPGPLRASPSPAGHLAAALASEFPATRWLVPVLSRGEGRGQDPAWEQGGWVKSLGPFTERPALFSVPPET